MKFLISLHENPAPHTLYHKNSSKINSIYPYTELSILEAERDILKCLKALGRYKHHKQFQNACKSIQEFKLRIPANNYDSFKHHRTQNLKHRSPKAHNKSNSNYPLKYHVPSTPVPQFPLARSLNPSGSIFNLSFPPAHDLRGIEDFIPPCKIHGP